VPRKWKILPKALNSEKENYVPFIAAEGCLCIFLLLFILLIIYPMLIKSYLPWFVGISVLSFVVVSTLSYLFLRLTWNSKKADYWIRTSTLLVIVLAFIGHEINPSAFVDTACFFIATGGLLGDVVSKVAVVYKSENKSGNRDIKTDSEKANNFAS
jgi:hypothetical protein